jgi:hypothetical protein
MAMIVLAGELSFTSFCHLVFCCVSLFGNKISTSLREKPVSSYRICPIEMTRYCIVHEYGRVLVHYYCFAVLFVYCVRPFCRNWRYMYLCVSKLVVDLLGYYCVPAGESN